MSDDNSDSWSIQLNRRNVLGAMGTVGAASALGGAGTMAWLSDTESFDGNMVTAGTLNLKVDYQAWHNGNAVNRAIQTRDGGTGAAASIADVKPGDHGKFKFCPHIHTNPAYLWMCGALTANDENGQNEAERNHSKDTSTGPGDGELADAIRAKVFYCPRGNNNVTFQGVSESHTIAKGSLRQVLVRLQAGLPLDGTGDGSAGVDRAPFPGSNGDNQVHPPCVCIAWKVPRSVGNEIQSDTLSFDVSFHAEQARHNDGTHNLCAEETFTAPYINPENHATKIEGTLRLDVNYGPQVVTYRVQMDDDDSGPKMSTPLNSVTNVWVPFDVDEDGTADFQLQWYPGASFPADPFGYKEVSGGSWQSTVALPSGFSALKSGETVVFAVPRSVIRGDGNDSYKVGAHMSAGGEAPYAAISTHSSTGEIVPGTNFLSSAYYLNATVQ